MHAVGRHRDPEPGGARGPVRRGDLLETLRPLRGHRLTRRHGRRAAQAELRDISRRRVVAASSGVRIPFENGHARQLPVLTEGPFRYATKTLGYLDAARGKTNAAG